MEEITVKEEPMAEVKVEIKAMTPTCEYDDLESLDSKGSVTLGLSVSIS